MRPEPIPNGGLRRLGVRKLVLDGTEAAAGRRLEPIEKRSLGEEVAQVGSEAGHGRAMIPKCVRPGCVEFHSEKHRTDRRSAPLTSGPPQFRESTRAGRHARDHPLSNQARREIIPVRHPDT